jgi:ATP-binding cassette subfamily B protein
VLKNINLTINKGDCVGFVGSTGNGKSTLIDIIMGLLVPTEGEIVIDGKTIISDSNVSLWQMNIAHVPQSIYLSDGSIEDNIAFGVTQDEIDRQRVKNSAIKANISEKIESLTKGYDTPVGEQGVKLSGGERQRIGIARAFYKNTNTLILDEATSALDIITEKKIMKSIGQLGKDTTILIIAHRITTLNDCNFLVKIDDGGKSNIVSYKDFVDSSLI